MKRRSRAVVTQEGQLKLVEGRIYKPRLDYHGDDGPEKWKRMYYRARQKSWNASFRQAMSMFAKENFGRWPDRNWPFMPKSEADLGRKVKEVHESQLNQ